MVRLVRTSGATLTPEPSLETERMRTTPQGNWPEWSTSFAKTELADMICKWLKVSSLEGCRSLQDETQGGLSMRYGISLRKTGEPIQLSGLSAQLGEEAFTKSFCSTSSRVFLA